MFHTLRRVRLSQVLPHDVHSADTIEWRQLVVVLAEVGCDCPLQVENELTPLEDAGTMGCCAQGV